MAKHIVPLYADLIDGMDADGQQLVADLHAFFNPAVPSRLQAPPPLVAPRALGPKWRRPRTALVAALAIFALIGATCIVPLLQSLWSEDRGLQHVTQAGLARDLNLRQTINGVTVHLQKGYADANRVVIGYSIELPPTTPADRSPHNVPILTDDDGRTYRAGMYWLTGDSSFGAEVSTFEPPPGVTGARDIAFTLTFPEVVLSPKGSGRLQYLPGPWVFKFTLPMAGGRVVERPPTFTRADVELTFTRIVVAPSATRFDFRVRLDGADPNTSMSLRLSVRDYRGWDGAMQSFCYPNNGCFVEADAPPLDADAIQVDAVIVIYDRLGSDGKPLEIRLDGLVLPLR